MSTTRILTRWSGLLAASAILFAACSTPAGTAAPASAPAPASAGASTGASTAPSAAAVDMTKLVADATAEANLSTIALPHDWCNYGEVLDGFKAKYPGIAINELSPLGTSGDEIEAVKANQGNPGPQTPDVLDIGFDFGETNKDLFQPYKVATWDTIPEAAKSADGIWYGDYYGVLSFETNTAVVPNPPKDWSDLLKPEYKGQVSMDGDPRTAAQAISAVYSSALANGGSLDNAQPGLDFWKKVVEAGNFVPVDASPGTIVQGATPIAVRWSYNSLAHRDATAGNPTIDVTVPTSGRFGGTYVQAISKSAPHPNAAKLWMEYLYSDEGQLLYLKGYCNPIRYEDMVARGVVPADLAAKLPDSAGAVFPTPAQLAAATKLITEGWDTTVGVDVVKPPS